MESIPGIQTTNKGHSGHHSEHHTQKHTLRYARLRDASQPTKRHFELGKETRECGLLAFMLMKGL